MNLRPQKFLFLATYYFLVFCLLYYACFLLQCGNYIKAEWWLKDTIEYKKYLNSIIPSPRIIIIGGSNALFGISSNVIEKITGYNVVNLSSHGALDLNFHYITIKENMKEGDLIIMPLEYTYYVNDNQTDWFTDNMMAWGKEDYLSKINLFELIQFIFHVPKKRIYEGLLKERQEKPHVDKNYVIYSIVHSHYSGWQGYSFKSLNKYGEINVENAPEEQIMKIKKSGRQYIRETELSDRFVRFYNKVSKLAEKRNGKVILTWPVSVKNKSFDLSQDVHQQRALNLLKKLQKESITIACDPSLFNMDYRYFFNSEYHLNEQGAQIRSEHLANCINDVIQ